MKKTIAIALMLAFVLMFAALGFTSFGCASLELATKATTQPVTLSQQLDAAALDLETARLLTFAVSDAKRWKQAEPYFTEAQGLIKDFRTAHPGGAFDQTALNDLLTQIGKLKHAGETAINWRMPAFDPEPREASFPALA